MIKTEQDIFNDLNGLVDEKYREFHSKLSPETNMILGVRVPLIKQYAKDFLKDNDWIESFKNIGDSYNEEKMLKGIIIGYSKLTVEDKLKYLEEIIPCINSWSSCDIICGTLKFATKNQDLVWDFLNKYIKSKKEFEVRFAVVMYLEYFINDEYVNKVIEKLNSINKSEYYVKMAIAWAVSIVIVKYPEIGIKYLKSENNLLDDFTYNKSIQKSIESYRVSDENKKLLKQLKRK